MWVTNSIIQGFDRAERVETAETASTPVALDIAVSRVFTEHAPGFFRLTAKGDVAAQVEVYKYGTRIRDGRTQENMKILNSLPRPQLMNTRPYWMQR